MPLRYSRFFVCLAVMSCWFGHAAADPAPIVYAGQTEPSPAPQTLAGGGETSYGYGNRSRQAAGAAIDLRRAGARSQPVQASAAPAVSQAGDRPQWLEQERVGPPYQANGRWYVPTPEPGYAETGTASWYGPTFHGRATASGEVFDQEALTAAHPTLPLQSLVQVTNLENGREVIVRVNDRGPFVGERLIDLSRRSAEVLGFEEQGHARVHVRYLGPAPRRVDASGAPVSTPNAAAPEHEPHSEEGPVSLLPASADQPALATPRPSAPPARAEGGVYVQVGAFSDLSNAQRVRDAAGAAGPASVDVRQTPRGELFRVRVGPFADAPDAETARRALADLGFGDAIVAMR